MKRIFIDFIKYQFSLLFGSKSALVTSVEEQSPNNYSSHLGTFDNLHIIGKFNRRIILPVVFIALNLLMSNYTVAEIALRGTATSATTTGTTLTINKPTGVVSGDVMIVNITQNNTNTNPIASGWTMVSIANQGNSRYSAILYKVADGTEGTSFTFTLGTGINAAVGSIIAFSGVSTSPFDVTPGSLSTGAGTTATASGITTNTDGAAVIFLGGSYSTTWTNWTSTTPPFSEIMNFNNGNNVSVAAAWGTLTTAGGTGSATVNLGTNAYYGVMLLALKPAPVPGGSVTNIFSYSGAIQSFTIPSCITNVTIEAWGGGGAGGGQNQNSDGGGGGGGGAYSRLNSYAVTPGDSYSYFIGAGGTGVASSKGGTGGDSYFVSTGILLAKGGIGGSPSSGIPPAGGAGGAAGPGVGNTKYSGGQGEIGRNNNAGQGGYGGSSAGTASNGYSGPQTFETITYPTASSPAGAGDGGNGGIQGNDGSSPLRGNAGGGGGSGDGGGRTGGSGGDGALTITYTLPGLPTISLGSNPIVCSGANSTSLAYSATTGCPDQYSIVYNTAAHTAGFTDVANATLTGSPISLSVPTGVAAATYGGILTVNNSSYGFVSSGYAITLTVNANSTDDQTAAGTNSWIGHVYEGTNTGIAYNGNFANYYGHYTEAETFNESFGGTTNCFDVTSNSTIRSIYTETFSVRYRMNSTKNGLYIVDLGSDDGSRLTVDGALIYNNWTDQGFTNRSRVLMSLNGTSSLVYDFYENGGGNQVVFQNLTQILANNLTTNNTQSICLGNSGNAISGDAYGTLPAGITLSGTGYQWAYSSSSSTGPWTDIAGATAATYTPSTAAAPFNAAGTYYMKRKAILSSANNVSPTTYVATNESNVATFTVFASVSASVSIAASANPICAGTSVTFTATPVNGGTTPAYQWKLNGVNTGTNSPTYTNAALTNGNTVSCAMTSNATCVNGSPATSNTITMTVNPVLPASVSIAASANPICAGTSVTFTATPVNGGTTPAYQWKLNGVNAGTNSPTYTNAALTNGNTVSCVMTSNATCVNGSPANSNSITMTVNPVLPASVSIAAVPTGAICAGTSVTFTATPTNGGTSPAYQWKVNGVNVGTNSTAYTNVPANTDAVTCVLTSNANCATGSPATSNTVTMTVNPNLPVSISIAASANPVCAGTSVTFTATPTNGGTTPAYQWKLNGSNVGSNSNTYTNIALANGNTVSCVLTSTATCTTGNPATSNTVTMTMNPNLPVSVAIAASANPVCAGTSVTYTATPTNGGAAPAYQWKVNGVNAGTNSATYTFTPANTNIVTCVLTSNATCATGSPATSNTVTMTVNPNLPVSVVIAASANPVCAGTSVTFTATPTNGGTTPAYQWKLNGSNVGSNSNTYTNSALANGNTVSCVLTSTATCTTGNPATSNTVTMTMNPNLPVSVAIAASANPVCAGTSVTYTATPTNGGAAPAYQWKVNGVNAGTNSATYTYTPANNNTVTCVLTSNATCATGSPATSNTVTMTVNAAPAATISYAGIPYCTNLTSPQSVILTGTTGGIYTASPAGLTIDLVTGAITPSPSTVGNYTVTYTMAATGGCSAQTATTNLTVNAPIGNNSAGVICATASENGNVTLTAPAGSVFTAVIFASYGTPNGTCPDFTIGSCHAATSISVAEGYLLGKNTATIPATNGVFGDPCVGTYKKLYISASYSPTYTPSVCSGTIPGTITASTPTGGSGTYTYLWESSTTSSVAGFNTASGTNNGKDYSPRPLTQTTWFRRNITSGGCSDVSAVTSITIKPYGYWSGASDINWNNTANWTCGMIPTSTTNVLIAIGKPFYPTLSAGAAGTVNNLTIESGASVIVSGNILQIAGTITNAGIFTATSGTIEMISAFAQPIAANTFAGNSIMNLNINNANSTGVTLLGPLKVTGIVKAIKGTLNSGGFLTLISTATQTALIDGAGAGEVLGKVTMQRYLPKNFGYKYISSPFTNATTYSDFAHNINQTAPFPTFFSYNINHQVSGADVSGWTVYNAGPLTPLHGYAANITKDRDAAKALLPVTFDLTGIVNNGAIELKLEYTKTGKYTQGFNLVGNPYPSPVSWNAAGWTKTNIDAAVHFFKATDPTAINTANDSLQYQGTYSSYVNGIPSGDPDDIIASLQGFFVHVTNGSFPVQTTLGVTNAVRTNDLNPLFKTAKADERTILRFSANFETKNALADPTVIYFDENASLRFDKDQDALKMLNTDVLVPNLYTLSTDPEQLSINGMPLPTDSITKIPLGISTLSDGWINFTAKDISQLPSNLNIHLFDAEKGITQDLTQIPVYRFFQKTGVNNQRFTLVFSLSALDKPKAVTEKMFKVSHSGDRVLVLTNLTSNSRGSLSMTNMAGQNVMRRDVFEKETVEISPYLVTGVYVITIISEGSVQSEKILIRKDYE